MNNSLSFGSHRVRAARSVNRWSVLSVGTTLCAALLSQHVFAAEDSTPVKIGLVFAKEGSSAIISQSSVRGAMMAAQEEGNKVLGRPVQFVWVDEPNPQGAQQNMQGLIDNDKVVAVMGATFSSSALAMEALARRTKTPLIITQAAASEITGKECNRYTFRVSPTAAVHTKLIAPFMAKMGLKWYTVTPSYAFGQDALASVKVAAKSLGATIIGSDEIANNTTDFSSYILKIRQAKPDVVFNAMVGGDLSNFLKQWNQMGMKSISKVVGIAVSDSNFWEIGAGASSGTYGVPWYYADPKNSPAEVQFVADYTKQYQQPPTEKAWMSWYATRALLGAITSQKSTDPKAIVTGMEAFKDTMNGLNIQFRSYDHQLVRPALAMEVKPKVTDKYDYFNIVDRGPSTQAELETVFGTKEQTGCNMGGF